MVESLPWNRQSRPLPLMHLEPRLRRGAEGECFSKRLYAERRCQRLLSRRGRVCDTLMVDVDCRHHFRVIDVQHGLRMVVEPKSLATPPAQSHRWKSWSILCGLGGVAASLLGAGLLLLGVTPPGAIALGALGAACMLMALGICLKGLWDARREAKITRVDMRELTRTLNDLDASLRASENDAAGSSFGGEQV